MPFEPKNVKKIFEEADITGLLSVIDKLDKDTRNEVLKTLSSELTDVKKRKALENIKQTIRITDTETRDWLVQGIPTSYVEGIKDTDELLKKTGIKIKGAKMTVETLRTLEDFAPHLQAVNALVSEAYLDFGNSMNGLVRGAERIFNDALKRQSRSKLIEGRLTGASIKEISKEVKEVIGQQGFTVLLDRGGKKWSLNRYSEMLARTHLIRANTEASINRCGDFNVDIVEISDHNTDCPICIEFEGKIFSISGKSENYPKLVFQPVYHPNCKHTILPRPDLS